jgi:hypothetical protein
MLFSSLSEAIYVLPIFPKPFQMSRVSDRRLVQEITYPLELWAGVMEIDLIRGTFRDIDTGVRKKAPIREYPFIFRGATQDTVALLAFSPEHSMAEHRQAFDRVLETVSDRGFKFSAHASGRVAKGRSFVDKLKYLGVHRLLSHMDWKNAKLLTAAALRGTPLYSLKKNWDEANALGAEMVADFEQRAAKVSELHSHRRPK